MSKDIFLNPNEIEKRRGRKQIINTNLENEIENSETKKTETKSIEKFYKRSGKACIEFESMGRFDLPNKLYFTDYLVEHVNDLTLAGEDTLLETVIAILDEIKNEDFTESIGNALLEEFMEVMVGIKVTFNSISHEHKWVCQECEKNKKEDEETVYNDYIINLKELKYKSIEEADQILRDLYRPKFLEMSDSNFEEYLKRKYKEEYTNNLSEYDRDTEVNKIRIEEPLSQNIDGDIYSFRFMRIKDLIKAKSIVEKKYSGKIKMIQNKTVHGVNAESLKLQKKEELDKINKEKAKEILITTRALSLISLNGKELNDEEKIAIYRKIPRGALFEFIDFLDKIKFGIQDEREFVCPQGHVSKRLLQRRLDPLEFLPIESASSDKFKESKGVNIFIGI